MNCFSSCTLKSQVKNRDLTLANKLASSNQIVDASFNINEASSLLSMQVPSSLHQASDILREEIWIDCVDNIE
jgi:hypothetical protein